VKQFNFKERAILIHGEKYNYDKVDYKDTITHIEIICPIHGSFLQKPKRHIKGSGCPKCGGTNKLTQSDFIERSQKIHKNKYDYSLSVYENYEHKVIIICPTHGEFTQSPHMHLSGQGCPRCGGTNKLTQSEFIERSQKIHNDKYDYSLSVYKNYEEKVIIVCKMHGQFLQTPHMHLYGNGCPACRENIKRSLEDFIKISNNVHNFKYNYDKTIYINDRTEVIITCPKHGDFNSAPNNHIFGATGCYKCKSSKGEELIRRYLTEQNIQFEEQKRFSDCVNKRCLPFDFFIPCKNILIEFQGYQHFNVVKRSKTMDDNVLKLNLEKIQQNDKIKKEWCKNNNIKLIEISYLEKKDINEILKNHLLA
jgi:hypothetical protein